MSYEERDHSGFYDDNSIDDPYRLRSGEQGEAQRQGYDAAGPGSYYGGQGYYGERRCTPMGAPKRTKRRKGAIVALLIVALLAGAAFGAAQVLRRYVLPAYNGKPLLSRTDDTPENGPAQPEDDAQPSDPDEALTQSEDPSDDRTAPEHGSHPKDAAVVPSPSGVETVVSSAEGALSLQRIYEKMSPSVVSIIATLKNGTATGTGIIMSESGYIITNHHVIEGAGQLSVLTHDDQQYPAELIGSDTISDLAVLRIEADGLTAAEFGDSDSLRVGDSVVAIGDPLGIQLRGTMTSGIISAINRDLTVEDRKMTLIQTDAALNSGNSGGPLINCYGQVIGINTMKMSNFYSSSTTVEGIGFAIPIDTAKPIIDELIEKGYVSGRPAIATYRIYYRLPQGIYVTRVYRNSDAAAKGISEGDIITAINGVSVTTMEQLNRVKNQFTAGQTITLTIYHGGVSSDVEIILMDRANA